MESYPKMNLFSFRFFLCFIHHVITFSERPIFKRPVNTEPRHVDGLFYRSALVPTEPSHSEPKFP